MHGHTTEHALAIVGAGPRGTSVLERICASARELTSGAALTVHVVDPSPPGPGSVWRTGQSRELLMNTVASQVTLFTDSSVECEGPILRGPGLYAWARSLPHSAGADRYEPWVRAQARALGPDDYPSRAFYGHYLEWVFRQVLRVAPGSVTVRVHTARAVRLEDAAAPPGDAGAPPGAGLQTLTLDDGGTLDGLAAVILAQGHLPVSATEREQALADYADVHGLSHFPPANPADLDLSAIAPGEPVLMRGLGLNFFDHMALLTSGRGGSFHRVADPRGDRADGTLRYLASGREPRIYAGSRRGIPYHARGDNAKGPHDRHQPLLLTAAAIEGLRGRAASGDLPDFVADVWPLVAKEVETTYYCGLLSGTGDLSGGLSGGPSRGSSVDLFRDRYLRAPHGGAEEAALLDEFGIPAADRWDWTRLAHPHRGAAFDGRASFRGWLLGHLRQDVAQARLGNVDGPLKAALDVLRDLRNELRQVVDHSGLAGASHRDHLDRWYTPLNAFLSIGPPRRRVEELVALIEAGVVDILGPRLELGTDGGPYFTAESPDVPGSRIRATTLIEARLPEPDLRRTADPLLARLLAAGACRPYRVGGYETGGVDVTTRPYRLIDRRGRAHPRRFAVGVPTEGAHWVTAAGARPWANSVTLADADAVARAALLMVTGRPPFSAVPEPATDRVTDPVPGRPADPLPGRPSLGVRDIPRTVSRTSPTPLP
ncbi:FAD/NAD(P)-binding protein [Streptomyces sp. H10-C2]|uniref:FAD/NAD(P)-binding protein n=1 Tax=unclassified Streptomyces TaxID=2593676 RepID=UPI0024B8E970|nr:MULTISPECIES: FAD/NAD(P)-binding protein [unclassified Streptomyces]MDJ0343669.1 FAD/NAD(P)-binding protein [Streptomyces sp. PH10-H1]MDJ0372404.1 FAD/NAD(P)-binding protein [Streptomyces sp. H10-C2]